MAFTKCPECEKEISSKASFCPHCGYPVKEQEITTYSLQTGKPSSCGFATFLRVCAAISWIGGLILAISGARVVDKGYYSSYTHFDFAVFLTLIIPYIIYGVLFCCMGTIVEKISFTYDIVSGIHLTSLSKNITAGSTNHGSTAPKSNIMKGSWKCSKCGANNPAGKTFCKDCGEYR